MDLLPVMVMLMGVFVVVAVVMVQMRRIEQKLDAIRHSQTVNLAGEQQTKAQNIAWSTQHDPNDWGRRPVVPPQDPKPVDLNEWRGGPIVSHGPCVVGAPCEHVKPEAWAEKSRAEKHWAAENQIEPFDQHKHGGVFSGNPLRFSRNEDIGL